MKTIIIIPAYNEAKKIFNVARQVRQLGYDVVVVDDGSLDHTASQAARAEAIVLRHIINRGYGAALCTGNLWALRQNYDIIIHFDADGQHNALDIKNLIDPIKSGKTDVVLGSRFLSGSNRIPFFRRLFIKLAILFTWVFSGIKLHDAHNGLRAFSNCALRRLDCHQDGMAYASEVIDEIAENKLRWQEIPVTIKYTDYSMAKGESNFKKILLGLRFLWGRLIR